MKQNVCFDGSTTQKKGSFGGCVFYVKKPYFIDEMAFFIYEFGKF